MRDTKLCLTVGEWDALFKILNETRRGPVQVERALFKKLLIDHASLLALTAGMSVKISPVTRPADPGRKRVD